jgi:hypothetical protein
MAKKTNGPNKSQAIRDYYAANPEAKPKQVVEALAAQGVDVSAAFVSTIKSTSLTKGSRKTGAKRGPRSVKAASEGTTSRSSARESAASRRSEGTVSIESLVKAKGLVKELGGLDNAISTLEALKRLAD